MTNQEIQEMLMRQIARDMESALYGGTNTTQQETTLTSASLKASVVEWGKMLRNTMRSAVTFVVDRAHHGPMLGHVTPDEGMRYELSWAQANEVHQRWPLKLHQVLSADSAEFVPLIPNMGEWAPKHLPMPPYDLPEAESGADGQGAS